MRPTAAFQTSFVYPSLPLPPCFPAWLTLRKVSNMLRTWCYTSTHTNTQHDTWQWSSSWWKITTLSPRRKASAARWDIAMAAASVWPVGGFPPPGLGWFALILKVEIFTQASDWRLDFETWHTKVGFYDQSLVLASSSCLLLVCWRVYFPPKNSFAPHLSLGLSVRESQLFVSVSFSKSFLFLLK